MFKALVILVCVAAVGGTAYLLYFRTPTGTNFSTVTIGNKVFHVEVADTDAKREQGLSGRSGIGSDGMLFVFAVSAKHEFWMKDMKFPLDFIWIKDGFVVGTNSSVPFPASGEAPATVDSAAEANYVLEVPEGTVQRYGIDRGSQVKISLSPSKLVQ